MLSSRELIQRLQPEEKSSFCLAISRECKVFRCWAFKGKGFQKQGFLVADCRREFPEMAVHAIIFG